MVFVAMYVPKYERKVLCVKIQNLNSREWYNRCVLPDLVLDDVLRLRKPHPCGGYTWRVVRLGADIGLECVTCKRRVLLSRRELAHRLKQVLPEESMSQINNRPERTFYSFFPIRGEGIAARAKPSAKPWLKKTMGWLPLKG